MSGNFYNLIMLAKPEFYSGNENEGEFEISKDRFLEHTEYHIKENFQSLDEGVIKRLKGLPAIFATEKETTDARIGKITDMKVFPHRLEAKYKFDEDCYPLTSGVLKKNWQKLGIKEGEFTRNHWALKECNLSDFYKEYLKSLTGIAHQLKNADKKVLIYAFNGSGKTRLSREFKDLIAPKVNEEETEDRYIKVLYYNAFTEDLFYWDKGNDTRHELIIQKNNFTQWVLDEQGKDKDVIDNFQRYTSDKLTPKFNHNFSNVTFSFERGNDKETKNIKISKGEESNFIWSIFYTFLEHIIDVLNTDIGKRETERYDQLEYVFIDDPVTSLDENHLIELAVNMAELINSSKSNLRFIITTHSPLFYNVLYSELKLKNGYILSKLDDGSFNLEEKKGASNTAFAYHLHIKKLIEQAIDQDKVQRYHFTLLRNLYEKTAAFFGYQEWNDLLDTVEGDKKAYIKRIIQFSSHSRLSNEEIAELTEPEKQTVKFLLEHLTKNCTWPK